MSKKKKKILVFGYFGYVTNQLDGQTVKTRDLYRLITEQFKNADVKHFDTQIFQYSKCSIFKMIWLLCQCNRLVYLPAHNNLKYLFPYIFVLSKIFRFKIDYFVVGGWLCSFIKGLPIHRWMLRRINGIHVETKHLLNGLKNEYGFTNVAIFPNFRFFDYTPTTTESSKLRIVFMARVNKLKGLDWIFELAGDLKESKLDDEIEISFYGPINKEDKRYFFSEINKFDFLSYKGALAPSEIHRTLNEYDVSILPTHYYTEGLPGSIVDSYIAGIPVIVTEWLNAREFVDDGKTGFIIPFKNGQKDLIDKVKLLNRNRPLLKQMQHNALKKREEFTPPLISL